MEIQFLIKNPNSFKWNPHYIYLNIDKKFMFLRLITDFKLSNYPMFMKNVYTCDLRYSNYRLMRKLLSRL